MEKADIDPEVKFSPSTFVGELEAALFASSDLVIGYRYYQDQAYAWCRRQEEAGRKALCLYTAASLFQFNTQKPENSEVISLVKFDSLYCNRKFKRQIDRITHLLDAPRDCSDQDWAHLLSNEMPPKLEISNSEIHESLQALNLSVQSVDDLRYLMAAGVVLNEWLRDVVKSSSKLKKFYAFKEELGKIINNNVDLDSSRVTVWRGLGDGVQPVYVRIDSVDFSFHAIPLKNKNIKVHDDLEWTGFRLKPIAPLVLAWARRQRQIAPDKQFG